MIPVFAILLVVATVTVSLVTGHRLGQRRKELFQLEMRLEQRRREAAELTEAAEKNSGQVRALRSLRRQKQEHLEELYDRLRALRDGDDRAIGVSSGLRPRALEEMAA